jgi:CRISPR-associated protein Csb1
VFPPTYATEAKGKATYATEPRVLADGSELHTVLLDSVQSQANRMEQALKTAWEKGDLELPVLTVKIPREDGYVEVTSLDAPHRAADAIFRDSEVGGVEFRKSEIGRRFVTSKPADASALFGICPTALLFGQWDSTAGAGTQGAKFQRVIVSEIVGYGASAGVRTASRIDPLQIAKDDEVELFKSEEGYWTFDSARASRDKKGQPLKTKPSEVNHGNVAPSVNEIGGFTIQYAEQISVISFPALRRLRFPIDHGKSDPARDTAARTAIAALGLHAVALLLEDGYDLRSRCLLVPVSRTTEWLGSTATETQAIELDHHVTGAALTKAVERARGQGLRWEAGRIELVPSEKLVELVRRSG